MITAPDPTLYWTLAGVFACLIVGSLARFIALRNAEPELRHKRLISLRTWWMLATFVSAGLLLGRLGICLLLGVASCIGWYEITKLYGARPVDKPAIRAGYALIITNYLLILSASLSLIMGRFNGKKRMTMMSNNSVMVVLLLACLSFSTAASAQQVPDAIINNDGIGFSRMADGELVAYDLVSAYDEQAIVVANCGAFKASVQGVSWCFASADNMSTFEAATQENGRNQYLPFVGGHCAMGVSVGNLTARGDPRTAVRIGNQLVLNGRLDVRTSFLQDTERNMDNARLRYELAIASGNLRVND